MLNAPPCFILVAVHLPAAFRLGRIPNMEWLDQPLRRNNFGSPFPTCLYWVCPRREDDHAPVDLCIRLGSRRLPILC